MCCSVWLYRLLLSLLDVLHVLCHLLHHACSLLLWGKRSVAVVGCSIWRFILGACFFLPCLQQCGLAFIAPQRKDTIIIQTLSHHGRIERSLQGGPCLVRTVRKGGCLLDFLTEVRVQVKTRVLGSGQDLHFVYPRNWSGLLWVSGEAGSEFHWCSPVTQLMGFPCQLRVTMNIG